MAPVIAPHLLVAAVGGLIGGLVLLVRGMGAYRTASVIGDTGTSTIASLAVGEARVSGVVEPAELLLVSPLQSADCVYYRSSVSESRGDDGARRVFSEERAVGFRVRDVSGSLRVFPRGAAWDVPAVFDEGTGMMGEEPPGVRYRAGPAIRPGGLGRDAEVAALLTVNRSTGLAGLIEQSPDRSGLGQLTALFDPSIRIGFDGGRGRRSYEEARLEPGETVTIVGQALPFDQLADPAAADIEDPAFGPADALSDPEIAADIAEARAAGILETDPEEAWGNAAIPGFGIGRPIAAPELDPAARPLPLATAAEAEQIERTFEISPDTLVLVAGADARLLISIGGPSAVAARHDRSFLVGLLGAALSIVCAVALAAMVSGGLG